MVLIRAPDRRLLNRALLATWQVQRPRLERHVKLHLNSWCCKMVHLVPLLKIISIIVGLSTFIDG